MISYDEIENIAKSLKRLPTLSGTSIPAAEIKEQDKESMQFLKISKKVFSLIEYDTYMLDIVIEIRDDKDDKNSLFYVGSRTGRPDLDVLSAIQTKFYSTENRKLKEPCRKFLAKYKARQEEKRSL